MPNKYVYVGDEGRVYPSLPAPANGPKPGKSYTLRRDPGDGRWELKDAPAQTNPTTDPAPAGETQE